MMLQRLMFCVAAGVLFMTGPLVVAGEGGEALKTDRILVTLKQEEVGTSRTLRQVSTYVTRLKKPGVKEPMMRGSLGLNLGTAGKPHYLLVEFNTVGSNNLIRFEVFDSAPITLAGHGGPVWPKPLKILDVSQPISSDHLYSLLVTDREKIRILFEEK